MLDVRSIAKRFGSIVALDGVDLRVARGQMVGFLGPNGAGKTTTMRAILGLLALDGGAITWDGAPIGAAVRSRIGYMPAERGMYPSMKAREHVVYVAELAGLTARAASAAADRWLARVGLADRGDSKVQDLSSGNQQRVQLALALVHDPELLVLDEPFSGLDPVAVDVLEEVLLERVEAGAALLFSSHQLDLVEDLTRDVVIVDHGRVVLSGNVDDLRAGSRVRYVDATFTATPDAAWQPVGEVIERTDRHIRLRTDASADGRTLLDQLADAAPLASFSFSPPELSEVFRNVVGGATASAGARTGSTG
ncbi:MAG: ATP-binding cassette protein [Ilumatobacteraceae bacterium]|nr:ATP-binding cassette protein [Ilumatobacteraceae bacterium]